VVAAMPSERGREEAERFVEEVCGDEPELAVSLRIEERERWAGGLSSVGQIEGGLRPRLRSNWKGVTSRACASLACVLERL
jgi:hypothetical protein